MPIRTLLDNDAVLVIDIDEVPGTGRGGAPIPHTNALLIGVRDGSGSLLHRHRDEGRYLPVARGRVDWLGAGELLPQAGSQPFGEAMLVEVRSLPDAPGVTRTFGDQVLFRNDAVCVYEEILGPAQVRSMHSHAPRLIIPLTAAHAVQQFPTGAPREDRFPAGGAHWAPQVMVHEIRNVGAAPFWAIVVEHV